MTSRSVPSSPAPRPVDASMSLLRDVADTSVDPDYARVSAASPGRRARRGLIVPTLVVAGLLFGVGAIQNARSAPALEQERQQLVVQVKQAESENQQLSAQVVAEQQAIRELQDEVLGTDPGTQSQLRLLEVLSGSVPVTGPGVVVVVDDAPSLTGDGSQVVDQDLRQLVNGLWTAGAEAIAVNGHRMTARTAIRGAGSAITVDYVSLTPPYRVEAIGDPQVLPAQLQESSGGQWWLFLKQNYGLRLEVSTADTLTLQADPGLGLRHAAVPR